MNTKIKSEDAAKYEVNQKINKHGAVCLSDTELLAQLLFCTIPQSRKLLQKHKGFRNMLKNGSDTQIKMLTLNMELSRRILMEKINKGDVINSPQLSRDYLTLKLRDKEHECFYVIYMDSKHQVIHSEELFRGTIDSAAVPVREVVKEALKHNAAAMIVAHNHPSGVAEPSAADKALTETLSTALKMVGVKLLDHFVVGDSEVVSFAEMGCL